MGDFGPLLEQIIKKVARKEAPHIVRAKVNCPVEPWIWRLTLSPVAFLARAHLANQLLAKNELKRNDMTATFAFLHFAGFDSIATQNLFNFNEKQERLKLRAGLELRLGLKGSSLELNSNFISSGQLFLKLDWLDKQTFQKLILLLFEITFIIKDSGKAQAWSSVKLKVLKC